MNTLDNKQKNREFQIFIKFENIQQSVSWAKEK